MSPYSIFFLDANARDRVRAWGGGREEMNALAALAAAESALARDTRGNGPGELGAHGPVFAAAPPPNSDALVFAGKGTELLSKLEEALLAEARARPGACGLALGKAVELLGEQACAGGSAESTLREPEVFVEEALARSLAHLEDTLLLRARAARASDRGGAASREAIVRADQALRPVDATQPPARVSLKTGMLATPLKRPSSAPLVRLPAADGGSDLRNRQRAYDDRRAGRVRTPQHAVVRPIPKVFDANATCNHCFKPVRVRRDENGRLQPQLSNRLARMSVPTFLGLPLVRATLHPSPCTLHKP
jgi:hypothetical protein